MTDRLVLALILISLAASVSSKASDLPPPPSDPVVIDGSARSVDSGMIVDGPQVEVLSANASKGDGRSAFRLWLHFTASGDRVRAKYWLLFAGARGYPSAQYTLWFEQQSGPGCELRLEALAWLRSAAIGGDPNAKSQLTDYEGSMKSCSLDEALPVSPS